MANSSPREQKAAPFGRVLVFALDGHASLPVEPAPPLPPANPSSEAFTDAQIELGKAKFGENCGMCHGWGAIGGDLIPDLRRVAAVTDRALWQSIVIDGALQNAGMVSFKPYLSPAEVEAIRSYVSHQARILQSDERGTAP